ncbi:hypothetical protein [Peribacillus sp. CSMR9]|uniref:hypothetical protein n=1 Tax=Peribacillus sp. CSMR9 TaxID=2981350 RepID=UPI0026911F52|nr:hypothetical protein [Peribacillus sp. CSMR9]MDV7767706.1 hypothetical protein [Peribacillus sp. CSMR9]
MTKLIIFVYLTPTLIGLFFAGPLSPLVGLAIGFPIHLLILLSNISKTLDEIAKKLYE